MAVQQAYNLPPASHDAHAMTYLLVCVCVTAVDGKEQPMRPSAICTDALPETDAMQIVGDTANRSSGSNTGTSDADFLSSNLTPKAQLFARLNSNASNKSGIPVSTVTGYAASKAGGGAAGGHVSAAQNGARGAGMMVAPLVSPQSYMQSQGDGAMSSSSIPR